MDEKEQAVRSGRRRNDDGLTWKLVRCPLGVESSALSEYLLLVVLLLKRV